MELLDFEKIKDKALRLLARRDHSAFELKQKLRTKLKIDNEVFEKLLIHLKDLGLMADEKNLSERWLLEFRKAGRGRRWIAGKLKTKGLPQVELTDDEDEKASALHFLERKLRGKELSALSFQEKAKVSRALVSRGFSHSLVASLLK